MQPHKRPDVMTADATAILAPEIQPLIEDLRQRLAAHAVVVSLAEENQFQITHVAEGARHPTPHNRLRIELKVIRHIAAMNHHLLIDDMQSHPLLRELPDIRTHSFGALAGFPVRDRDRKVRAVVCALYDRIHRWSHGEEDAVDNAAREMAVLLAARP